MASEIGKAASSCMSRLRKLTECKAKKAVEVADESIETRKKSMKSKSKNLDIVGSSDAYPSAKSGNIVDVSSEAIGEYSGYPVDLSDLLFTPERDFLVRNNGDKVMFDDLNDKTIVLFIFPLYDCFLESGDTLDMIQAYHELLPLGGTEFVLVPVYLDRYDTIPDLPSKKDLFNHFFSTIPFPAVPFSDIRSCGDRVVQIFSVNSTTLVFSSALPYWAIVDPNRIVVATRFLHVHLFKFFNGAELHPLSTERLRDLDKEYDLTFYCNYRRRARKRLISKFDQLLASPTRDYLLSSNGNRVPISDLKGKVVGLYFCENIPQPPSMELVKKVYAEAKSRGLDFEIVQINFHFHFFNAVYARTADTFVQQRYENVDWLTLPFGDPSCRKLQRIFKCETYDDDQPWTGDCLVIVDARQEADHTVFEFSGVEIFKKYGVEGYPFTRNYLVDKEHEIQKQHLNLQLIFPPGRCLFYRPAPHGFDLVGDSQLSLSGKRVLVLFASNARHLSCEFVSMLKTKYLNQLHNATQGNKFEVVYVSDDFTFFDYKKSTRDMPWLVHRPGQGEYVRERYSIQILKTWAGIGAAAFNTEGELIAKESNLESIWATKEHHKAEFPFVLHDLKWRIPMEVESMCELDMYYYTSTDDEG